MENQIIISGNPVQSKSLVEICDIQIDEAYAKEWNESSRDFVALAIDGKMINNCLYRIGGLGTRNIAGKDYFILLKYIEDYYSSDVLKMSKNKDPKHLSGVWCILDKYGNEKVLAKKFETIYLVSNSVIYQNGNSYFNIETGYYYGSSYKRLESKDFIFIEESDVWGKRPNGVIKINKKTGEFEFFQG